MKALITQREQINPYEVPIDVLESTYVTYFENLGIDLFVLSNFTVNLNKILDENEFEVIILTGGGSLPTQFYNEIHGDIWQANRDKLEWKLMEYSVEKGIPVLGICRGMEYMNAYLGGKITKLTKLNKNRSIGEEHIIILGDGVEIYVNNYHNDGIYSKDLAKEFKTIGLDKENDIVEAFYSKESKWLGLQWHPERLMKDYFSKMKCTRLIEEFTRSGGIINESYYFSSGARD